MSARAHHRRIPCRWRSLALGASLLLGAGMALGADEAGAPALPAADPPAAADPLPQLTQVQFSDGRSDRGACELPAALQLHDGATMRSIPADQVRSIELIPLSEAMVQGWRFVEPGQPRKEDVGRPYPVRHLQALITTVSGERISGHLTTTVAWLTTPPLAAGEEPDRERIILPAKQEGSPGQTLADLVYPVRIVLPGQGGHAAGCRLRLGAPPAAASGSESVVVLSRGALARSEALTLVPPVPGMYQLPGPLEVPAFIARSLPQGITVGWPEAADPATTALVQAAVTNAQDFLDHRQLLGAWADGDDQLYGLLLLFRQGATTMAGPHPWRLEVWRWKHEGDHLLWASRAYFFRGLAANVEALPAVHLEHAWWSQTIRDGVCTVNEEPHGR